MSRQTQLNIVKAAGQRRFYDWIDFGAFRPELAGIKVRVHVNPPRAVRRNLSEIHAKIAELNEELKTCEDEERRAVIQAELKPLGERNIEIIASLLPTSDTDDTPLTVDELNEFLKGDDTDDDSLEMWFMTTVWVKVYEYFLSPVTSQSKSTVGNTR